MAAVGLCPDLTKWYVSSLKQKQNIRFSSISVADPGCLSRNLIFIYLRSPIPNPGSNSGNKRVGEKNSSTLFGCHKYHKTEKYSIFEQVMKIFEPIHKKLKYFLSKKLSKIWFSTSRGQKGTGSRIRSSNTG
jgi:hypothetical protein